MNDNINSDFRVLAKSNPEISLKRHIDDCLQICKQLETCIPNVPICNKTLFWDLLKTSIIFHDMGKSHVEFQKMLQGKPNKWYHQRHELFSLYFANELNLSKEQKELLLFTILGHHKSLFELYQFADKNYRTEQNELDFELDNNLSYDEECKKIDNDEVWRLANSYGCKACTKNKIDIYTLLQQRLKIRTPITSEKYFMELLLVGAMKQCDHLASAGIKYLQKIESSDFDFLFKYQLYEHQEKASQTKGNIILSAPTGSGKTETSFLWLKKQIETNGQGRIFYILPYTASINAMYERLNKEIKSDIPKVGMIHGKLDQYIENKMSTDNSINCESDKKHLIEDFRTLVTPIKITTPFQLLKNIFGLKGFEKGMFEWAGGYFIFDEIHAYDTQVFAQIIILLKFVTKHFNVSVHLMTATLPTFMKKEIENALGNFTQIVADTKLYKSFTRHKVYLQEGLLCDALDKIQEDINNAKKVLVVCNTVKQAQSVFEILKSKKKILLHGSFNSNDRFQKEKELKSDEIELLVGTQAIEVSLDIDFDIIYTEPAPLDALIQRFGRVNRKRKKGICPCFVFKQSNDNDKFIYKNEGVIERTLEVIKKTCLNNNGIIEEDKLQRFIDYVYPDWDIKDKQDFNDTYNCLLYALKNDIRPLEYNEQREIDYYKRFDGIKVLPISLVNEYQALLENSQFIKAEGLLVSIRKGRFISMKKNNDIKLNSFFHESSINKKIIEQQTYIIARKYNHDIGLVLDEFEKEPFENISI